MVKTKNLLPLQGQIYLVDQFLSETYSQKCFESLKCTVPWEDRSIKIFGREVLQPRRMAWYGDKNCSYKYSGTQFDPLPWHPLLTRLKQKIEKSTEQKYNSALVNLYRNERDSMGFHSDNEKELGKYPTIASLSLGAERTIVFIHKLQKDLKLAIELKSGSFS